VFFAWDITIETTHTQAAPKTQILKLSKGIITRCDIKFAPGCHGLVKVRIYRSESQLIPLSRGEWITGDAETIPTEGYYELEEIPTELKFIGWADGCNYNHTVTVRIQLLPKAVATVLPLVDVMTRFLQRIGVI